MPVITEVCGLDELRALWPREPFRFGAGPRPFRNLMVLMQSQAPQFETCEDGHRVVPPTGRAERPATPRSNRSASAAQGGNLSRVMCWFTVAASDAALRLPAARRLRTSFCWCGGEGRLAAEFNAPGLGVGPPAPDALPEAMEQFAAWMTWLWIIDAPSPRRRRR